MQWVRIVRTGPVFRLLCRMPELPEAGAVVEAAVVAVVVKAVAALALCRPACLALPLQQNRSGFFIPERFFC